MSIKRMHPDFSMLACAGLIPGITPLFKFGENPDIDTGTVPEDIISLGGVKLFPTTTSTISTVSDNAADTSAGTGIQTLRIEGLDINYNVITEDITMNGVTPVVSTKSFFRVYRLLGLTAGSSEDAVGNIIATHSQGAISEILASEGQSFDCTYTVPSNHLLLIERLLASLERSAAGAGATIHFEVKSFNSGVWRSQASISIAASGTSFMERSADVWFPIQAKTDVRVRVETVETNNTPVSASFDGYLIDQGIFSW